MQLSKLVTRRVQTNTALNRTFAARPSRALKTMATAPKIDIVVKGDPDNNKLGDCPFCHRVLLTLANKGVPYHMTYVDFARKPEWLIQASGGKVPVLREEAKGLVMPDSDVIVVHLEKEFPEPSMRSDLPPNFASGLFPAFRAYLASKAGDADEGEKREAVVEQLRLVNEELSKPGKGPLFGGTKLNSTDAAVAPKLYHCKVALKHFKGFDFPPEFSALDKYFDALKEQPAWKATDYGPDMIIAGWSKHH